MFRRDIAHMKDIKLKEMINIDVMKKELFVHVYKQAFQLG